MSGHNKWSKIKRAKEAKDKAKGNIFSKLSRLITLAVIDGNGITDPAANFKLRLVIDKAKSFNMPKDNIERAIKNAIGPDKALLKEVIYEAFGPAGVALIIEATTDNPNRTLSEVRTVLDKHQGKLVGQGAVSYLFKRCGMISFDKNRVNEDQVYELADKIKAFDIGEDEGLFFIYFPFDQFSQLRELVNKDDLSNSEIIFKPQNLVKLEREEEKEKLLNLIEVLEDLDDVQKVFTNADL